MHPFAATPEEQDDTMNATEAEYFRSIGRLEGQVAALTTAVGELKTKLDGIDTRLDTLDRMPPPIGSKSRPHQGKASAIATMPVPLALIRCWI